MEATFFDWATLGTFAGALAAVTLITELIKEVPGIAKIPTQFVSWVLGIVVLLLASAFTGSLTAQSAILCVFNGAMVSLAANGGYAALKRVISGNPKPDDDNEV